jgi:tape measure domain-containing protein
LTTIGTATLQIIPSLRGVSEAIDKQLDASGFDAKGKAVGRRLGDNIAGEVDRGARRGLSGIGKDADTVGARIGHDLGTAVGYAIGKPIGLAIRGLMLGGLGLAGLGTAGLGAVLFKGFERIKAIDAAKFKLEGLGKSAAEVKDTIKTVTDAVTGTPFALDQAFDVATQAIGSNVDDLKRFMTDVADAAGFAGKPIEQIGLVFNQILAKGKADGEDMRQLMEAGIPAKSWIMDSYNLTSDQFDKMQAKGEITMQMLEGSIERHAPGMAKKLGESLGGAIDNLQTAAARVGADLITAMSGGDTSNIAKGINSVTEGFNKIDAWVKGHVPEIVHAVEGVGAAFANVAIGVLHVVSGLERANAAVADFWGNHDEAKRSREIADSVDHTIKSLQDARNHWQEQEEQIANAAKAVRDLGDAEIDVSANGPILKAPTPEQLAAIDQAK